MIDVRLAPAGTVAGPSEPDRTSTAAALREAGGSLGRGLPAGTTILARPGLGGERLRAFVEGVALGGYRYTLATGPRPPVRRLDLLGADDADALERALRSARATAWARDLTNTPAATMTPAALGAAAHRELSPLGVTVEIHGTDWLAEHGFGGVLAVGGASQSPPRLVEASWRPRGSARGPHVVLVGKGITFDTGGLNIKLGEGMRAMKTDMAGGAAVLAALRLIAESRVPVRVTVLVPAAENSVGSSSYRPGDVVRHVNGRTSEITNTDAEGRIVLADALAHAAARLRPSMIVDVATLTGAMKVALGTRVAGMFATTDALAQGLVAAGEASGERLWRMPLVADYESALRSDVADANNSPGNPGAITAALFLKHFTAGLPWAHLDVAGAARAEKDDGARAKGATGFGAALLGRWVESLA